MEGFSSLLGDSPIHTRSSRPKPPGSYTGAMSEGAPFEQVLKDQGQKRNSKSSLKRILFMTKRQILAKYYNASQVKVGL